MARNGAPARWRAGYGEALRKLLRPGKARSALRRRWFERRMQRQDFVSYPLIELGTPYGGWIVPASMIERAWTCYSIGIGGDISFDLELIRLYGATVRGVEPVAGYVEWARKAVADRPNMHVRQAALALEDAPIRMQKTHVPGSESVSSVGLYETDDWVELPGRTLESLMADFGDTQIQLLKIDMEGAEYEWLRHKHPALAALGVRVLCVQLHHAAPVRAAREVIAQLRGIGFRPVACKPPARLTFVREDGG